jgi:hypothetical protein
LRGAAGGVKEKTGAGEPAPAMSPLSRSRSERLAMVSPALSRPLVRSVLRLPASIGAGPPRRAGVGSTGRQPTFIYLYGNIAFCPQDFKRWPSTGSNTGAAPRRLARYRVRAVAADLAAD